MRKALVVARGRFARDLAHPQVVRLVGGAVGVLSHDCIWRGVGYFKNERKNENEK